MNINKKAKPFLRWAGSKKQVIPKLKQFWHDDYNTYIEPFVGSAQFFFSINPKKAIISDINKELIETYLIIKKEPEALAYSLDNFPSISKEQYYLIRDLDLNKLTKYEKAARFIFLNRYCFNGLYRTNNSGRFNVPFCNSISAQLPTRDELLICSEKLTNTKILHGDFETITRQHSREGDFVYMDPPYAISNKKIFQQYNPVSFGLNDIERLKILLDHFKTHKINFLLSYAYTKEMVQNFSKWEKHRIITRRNIAGFSKDRKNAAELLVTNHLK